jgi:hypothetical protein
MKLARAFCFLILFGSSAIVAYAQTPVDPLIQINGSFDPACGGGGEPVCFAGGTLDEVYGSPVDFVYDGVGDLYSMTLVFTSVPQPVFFECETNIWTNCSSEAVGSTEVFDLYDTPADTGGPPCFASGGSTCPGYMIPDEEGDVTQTPLISDAPEPGSIFLFGTGLILFFVGTRRRLHTSRT